MLRRNRWWVTALCVAGAMACQVQAKPPSPSLSSSPSLSEDAPTVLRQNGIEYVSGGIGEEQVAEMRQMASHYSLSVMVAAPGGEYLSDVDVTIASATGKNVFSARTDGPYLLVRLRAGHYRVTAQSGHASQTRQVTVPAHGTARLDFHLATNES